MLVKLRGAAAGLPPEVTIEVADGGSGLGQLQLYRDGEALGPPTALRAPGTAVATRAATHGSWDLKQIEGDEVNYKPVHSKAHYQMAPYRYNSTLSHHNRW